MDLGFGFNMWGGGAGGGLSYSFYQPFDSADAQTNLYGGTSEDPSATPAKDNIQVVSGWLTGTTPTGPNGGDPTTSIILTPTTALSGIFDVSFNIDVAFNYGLDALAVSFFGTDTDKVAEFVVNTDFSSARYKVNVQDGNSDPQAVVYDELVSTLSPLVCDFNLRFNLPLERIDVESDLVNFDPVAGTDIDIKFGEPSDVKTIVISMHPLFGGTDLRDAKIDNIKVFQR